MSKISEMTQISLGKFKPSSMKKGSAVLVCGGPGCGKTTLIKDLIKRRNLRRGMVFSDQVSEWTLDRGIELLTAKEGQDETRLINKRRARHFSLKQDHFIVFDNRTPNLETVPWSVMDLLVASQNPQFKSDFDFDYYFLSKKGNTFGKVVLQTYQKLCEPSVQENWLKVLKRIWESLSPYEFLVIESSNPGRCSVYQC